MEEFLDLIKALVLKILLYIFSFNPGSKLWVGCLI